MIQRLIFLFGVFLIVSACAPTQKPKFQFPMDTRVGVVTHLEHFVTHQNFAELRIGSFSKTIPVDWNIPAYIEDKLTKMLQNDPRYTVISIKPEEPMGVKNQESNMIDQISMSNEIKPEVADFIESLANSYDADVIIFIKSYRGPSAFRIADYAVVLTGYGLFTRNWLIFKKGYPYANIAVIVFKTTPLTYLGSGKPNVRERSLKDIDLAGDLKNLPQSEINKLQPKIQKYADQAVKEALNDSNLIPPK